MEALEIEDVQNYPRPPALEPVSQTLTVRLAGSVVAQSSRGYRVLETHHAPTYYIPREDVAAELVAVRGQSFCEWKGTAAYWDVVSATGRASRAAWSYANPSEPFRAIEGHIAFYAALMEACFVGEHMVIPQPGDFYGGWVTDNLRGRIKGAPGTEFW